MLSFAAEDPGRLPVTDFRLGKYPDDAANYARENVGMTGACIQLEHYLVTKFSLHVRGVGL